MPKKKETPTGYPYRLPSLDRLLRLHQANPKIFKNRPAQWVNEFFLIEALLRSDKAKHAHHSGSDPELLRFFRDHNIIGQKPLQGSHHPLLTAPRQTLRGDNFGNVDTLLGIQDIGVLARLTPDTIRKMTRGTMEWPMYDGEQAVLTLLRNPSPRFVCLRFDASLPLDTILESKQLRRLFKERRKQSKGLQRPIVTLLRRPSSGVGEPEVVSRGPLFAFSDRQRAWTPFKDITMWLRYLKCYAMWKAEHSPDEISAKVFPGMGNGLSQYYSAIKQVKKAIKSAEDGTWPPSTSRRIS